MSYSSPSGMPAIYRRVDESAGVVLYAFFKEDTKSADRGMDGVGVGHGKMGAMTAVPLSETDLDKDTSREWKKVR